MKIYKFFAFFLVPLLLTVPVYARGDIIALMYHDFSYADTGGEGSGCDLPWSTSEKKFRNDILTLYGMGYESLSIQDYAAGRYDGEKLYFILTFDDGYSSCYNAAFPVLAELNAKAAVFLNTDRISASPDKMTWEQLLEMEKSGLVEAYSHMPVHIDATSIPIDEFSCQVERSCRMLEERLGNKINRKTAFAYPYGLYSGQTSQRLAEMGFSVQAVQDAAPNDAGSKKFIIRTNVAYTTDVADLAREHRLLNRPM